jgi:hypothetical protein
VRLVRRANADTRETTRRLSVTLDPVYAAKLAKMAERMQINEGVLARSLLSRALDDADPHPRRIADLLDGLPGALERAHQGLEDAKSRRTIALNDF